MSFKEQVRNYLYQVRRRLRWEAASRGLAVSGVVALVATVLAVLFANAWKFSPAAIGVATGALWLAVIVALAWWLIRPLLRRLEEGRIARFVEEHHPQFRDRLVTAVELDTKPAEEEVPRFFQELVAEDALAESRSLPPDRLIERRRIVRPLIWGLSSVALIFLLGFFGPGFFRYGTKVLWAGWAQAKVRPLYQLQVSPGDLTVGRNSDQEITARPVGFAPDTVRLFALYQNSPGWESAPMLPEEAGGGFRFLFMNIREPLQYYVEAQGVRSPQYRLSVVDVPHVERLEVRYHYPAYTGLNDTVEPNGGDIAALRGTQITLIAHTDVPSPGGRLVMDDGTELAMQKAGERQFQARWTLSKDAMYHIQLQDHLGRGARASDEYLIQALADSPPSIHLTRPGRDLEPTAVDEVVVGVDAQDDVRLGNVWMRYSVNGGPEKTVPLGPQARSQEVAATHTLLLEDYQLVPGDLVTLYGEAKDAAGATAQTEMYFLQVRPFERSYSQSQAGGGGGGGGQENTFLSERQKQILAATWNVVRKKEEQRPEQMAETAQVLSSVQNSLREQAETLASRVSNRELSSVNEEFSALVENLQKAAEAMVPAAEQLGQQKFQQALSPEQTALQHLLRAEALFRDIQVAFGNAGGGGGGGSSGRDLADLFSLELDTGKNQYETLNERGSRENSAELSEAMRKLEELARRQENLTRQEQEKPKESLRAASRWEQEMLRREAEELARKLEQLSRQTNSSQLSQAGQRLAQAARDMQQAGNSSGSDGSESSRALDRLREARDLIAGQKDRQDREMLDRLAERAQEAARQQQKIAEEVRQTAQGRKPGGEVSRSEREALAQTFQDKRELLQSLQNLERQLNQTASRLADTEKKAAQKLREAASSIQEERMEDKLGQGAWLAQQGLWATAAPMEEDLRKDLESLAGRVQEAQRALGQKGPEDKLRQALEAAERVRQGLESMEGQRSESSDSASRQPGEGQQPGQGQQPGERGQPGNQPGTQSARGNQPGGEQRSSSFGVPGSRRGGVGPAGTWAGRPGEAWNPGGITPATPLTPEEQRALEEQYRSLAREASAVPGLLGDEREFERLARELVRAMQNLDPRNFSGPREELARQRGDLVERWKELELRLRRQLQMETPEAVRLATQERVPEKYRTIVEEYYRALSRSER